MGQKFTNNAKSTVADVAGIIVDQTEFDVAAGEGALFPTLTSGDFFIGTLVNAGGSREIVKVTARSTDTMTMVRAQEGTSQITCAQNDAFELRLTAGFLEDVVDDIEALQEGTLAYVKVSDVKAYNVDGGTFTQDAYRTRDINTEDSDASGICSIASNQITLEAGTYICNITCPAANVTINWARLYDITGAAELLRGPQFSCGVGHTGIRTTIVGTFTLAVQSVLEVQHYCVSTYATTGFGYALGTSGYDSIYTVAEFLRILT